MDRDEFHKTAIEVEDEMGVCGLADHNFYEKFAWRISQRYNARLLAVAKAADSLIRHGDSPKWEKGLIPWREIAEGVNPDDLVALAEALSAVEDLLAV